MGIGEYSNDGLALIKVFFHIPLLKISGVEVYSATEKKSTPPRPADDCLFHVRLTYSGFYFVLLLLLPLPTFLLSSSSSLLFYSVSFPFITVLRSGGGGVGEQEHVVATDKKDEHGK